MTGPCIRAMEIICESVALEKLVWGSDFWFGSADAISYRLDLIMQADINPELRMQIFDQNPRKILSEEKCKTH